MPARWNRDLKIIHHDYIVNLFCVFSEASQFLKREGKYRLAERKKASMISIRFMMSLVADLWKHPPLELIGWAGGLAVLAIINPHSHGYPDVCLFKRISIPFCPGCGLGRSISCFLHGDPMRSLQVHPLGILATLILAARAITLLNQSIRQFRASKTSLS